MENNYLYSEQFKKELHSLSMAHRGEYVTMLLHLHSRGESVYMDDLVSGKVRALFSQDATGKYYKPEMMPNALRNPFPEGFWRIWESWKAYKREEKRQRYRSPKTEQAAIDGLFKKSGGSLSVAEKIIRHSIENQYTGLFAIKSDGKQQKNDGISDLKAEIIARNTPGITGY